MNKILIVPICKEIEEYDPKIGHQKGKIDCSDCYSDGCNGSIESMESIESIKIKTKGPNGPNESIDSNESSGAAQYGPITLLIALPVAFAKLASF